MRLKLLAAAGVASVMVLALGAPAFAHVTTDPDSARLSSSSSCWRPPSWQ